MDRFKTILYPTDFSEHSLVALPYALDLARQFGAELHCLHVVDEAYQYWLGAGETATVVPVVMPAEEMRKAAEEQMRRFAAERLQEVAREVITKVLVGRPFLEIIRYAREHGVDLIVLATHGRGAIASMLLGTVAEKVVRKSPCAVLTVRHPNHKFEAP